MITQRLEHVIAGVYARRRERYIETFWFAALGFLWLTVELALLIYLRYVDASFDQAARILVFHALLVPIVGLLVIVPHWREVSQPVMDWLKGDTDAERTAQAWQCAAPCR